MSTSAYIERITGPVQVEKCSKCRCTRFRQAYHQQTDTLTVTCLGCGHEWSDLPGDAKWSHPAIDAAMSQTLYRPAA